MDFTYFILCIIWSWFCCGVRYAEDIESGSSDVETKYKKMYEDDINPFAAFSRKVDIFELIIRHTCYLLYVLSLSFNPSHNFIFEVYFICFVLLFKSTSFVWGLKTHCTFNWSFWRRCRGSNPGHPRDRREYLPLYYANCIWQIFHISDHANWKNWNTTG